MIWELTFELLEYSNEQFDTGIPEIDIIQTKFSTNILDYSITDEEDNYITDEDDNYITTELYRLGNIVAGDVSEVLLDGSENYPTGSNDFIDFSVVDPFSEGVV